ncbi:hypothetical protein ABMA27_015911 [Loxostege sticticalis]|uniref:TNFR-Cys domain-containing protein n=1 Tax=Loxostege sticticalis TaxID=481309 RepID=A0ABR3I4U2_LOXSC
MFRIALLLAMNFVHAQLNQAPCTEDAHCSVGFYCEETALYCRQCLSCQDHQRESPPQPNLCVTSVVQCGDCLKGFAETSKGNDKISAGCVSFIEETGKHHPYLPSYAWAAIVIGLFLMLLTVCVFLKTKMFKVVSYSSATSVHSLRATEAAEREAGAPPPPYNYLLPSTFPPGSVATEMPEIRRLVDSPELCSKPSPELQAVRPREAAGNQEARVFNNPTYVRVPQIETRSNTPEVSAPEAEAAAFSVAHYDADTPRQIQPTGNIVKIDNDTTSEQRCASQNSPNKPTTQRNTIACAEVQDSNNNYPQEPSGSGFKGSSASSTGARLITGPSFVINVAETISNLHHRNQVNCYHTDTSYT